MLRGPGLFHIPQVNWQPGFQLRLGLLCLAQLRLQILELFCRSFHLRLDIIQFAFRFTPNGVFFPPGVFFLFSLLLRQTGIVHRLVGKRLFRLAAFAVDTSFGIVELLGQAAARSHSRPQVLQSLFQCPDEGCRVRFRELHVRLGLSRQCLAVQVIGQRFQLRGRLIRGHGIGGRRLDVLGDVVSHLAPGDVHAEHFPVAQGGGLHQKAGLIRHQIAVGFLHHGAAGEHIGPGHHARDKLVVVSADEQQHRQHQVRAQRQRIDVIHAHIALYFQCKGPGDGLAPHMDVVVETALLYVVILQFPAKGPHTLAGQVEHQLHAQHEIKIDQWVFPLVPNDPILIRNAGHGDAPPCPLFSTEFQNTLFLFLLRGI